MKAFFDIVMQWVRPLLGGLNIRLVLKALQLGYSLMVEVERQHNEGDRKFTNTEKAEWVKNELKAKTNLPDSVIDFVFGVAIARFIREKKTAEQLDEPATETK